MQTDRERDRLLQFPLLLSELLILPHGGPSLPPGVADESAPFLSSSVCEFSQEQPANMCLHEEE